MLSRIAAVVSVASPARRAGLLRLGVMLAALIGIALVQSGHCRAGDTMGMSMAGPADHSVSQVVSTPQPDASQETLHHDRGAAVIPVTGALAVGVVDLGPMPPAGITMACLAMFLALLAATVHLARGSEVSLVRCAFPRSGRRFTGALPRPPNLTELCVMRT
ncbi:hypothetical protein HGA13_17855 [Nocardia speluncae]|uniref:Uncharacterized protein n=2 Tax=Nocardia TaxID=1817 RepID=A0A846XEU7_9NOCA|nr:MULTISPECIES: hypothetical protein [Nocardia]NKY34921.1 hypothetical protein [Nocardia speluncae]